MVSKEPSHLLTGQTTNKSTLADKLPGTMTVRSVLLNRDSPDIESRLKKRRNRTHQVRFKDLEDGSSSSGNSGTGENNQRTSTDCSSPHPVRKHGSRTPLPWVDEPHISSLPGQTSVVGAVRGDMASTIEVVAAFLARAPPHPLTPGPTRRCWTPPQANSLTLPMTRKPSTSTAIQTSPCLKKPLSTHTRSHSLGDSVGIDGDDEHDSQDENFFHNHLSTHRAKDINGASECSERTTTERRSKSRTEMKSAVTIVKNSRHSGPPSVSHTEPCHCSTVSLQVGPKRPGSSTPSLVRRRKRFSRTTSDPGKEVHYCTTPTQTESHSLSPPRSSKPSKLCTTQVQTESPSSDPHTAKYSTTQSQTECHTQSLPVNDPTLPPAPKPSGTQTPTKSSSCHTPTALSIEPCTTQPQSKSPCASQIRSESLGSSLVKDRESLPNQTVPYNFTQLPPHLPLHITPHSDNKAVITKLVLSSPYSVSTGVTAHSLAPVITQQSVLTDITPHSLAPVVTPHSVMPAVTPHSFVPPVTPHSFAPVLTPHSVVPVVTPCSVAPVITARSVVPVVTPQSVAPVVASHSFAPVVASHSVASVVTPNSVPPDVTPHSVAPVVTPQSLAPVVTPQSAAPVVTPQSVAPVVTPHSVAPVVASHPVAPVVTPHSFASAVTPHSVCPVVTPHSVAPVVTPHSVAPVVTPHSVAPVAKSHSFGPVVTPYSVASAVTPHSVAPVVTPHSVVSAVTPHSVGPVVTPHSVAPAVTPHSVGTVVTPHSVGPVVTPHSVAPAVTPHSVGPVVTPHSVGPVVTPHSIAPAVTPHSVGPVVTPHSVGPVVTPHSVASAVTPHSVGPVVTPHSVASAVTPHSVGSVVTPHSVGPVVTPHSVGPVVTPHSVAPAVTPHSVGPVVTPHSVGPVVTPHSVAPAVTPHSVGPVVTPHSVGPVVTPHSVAPAVTPHSVGPVVTPHSVGPVVTPHSVASAVTPHSVGPVVTPHSVAPAVTPHSVAPVVTPYSVASAVTPHSFAPVATLCSVAPVDTPHSVAPVAKPHSFAPIVAPHSDASSGASVVTAQSVVGVDTSYSVVPVPNCSVVSPPAVILPVFSCSTSLSVIQDCPSPISNIDPATSLTCSTPTPVPQNSPVIPPNVTDITRHIPAPVNLISLLPNATSPTNVAPCTFVTQTAISCTSISYYTTTHPAGPTGPQSHILPPAYATLVQTVSHCNIPCQVLQNTVSAKITPFSSPVPKLKSCTSQPILVKTYTSNLPIMQQCVTPTKTAPLYSSTFRAAPPYTPPFQTQVKKGLRLPPPPPPPPPYTPRKNTNDQPATQTSALRTDNKTTEKDKDGSQDIKADEKCKDSPKLSGRVRSLKQRAQTPPAALVKERGSPAKACFKSSCLSSAHAQLGVLHKMLCSGARPRPNTPCQFPLPQSQQGCSRVRRCSVPAERSTAGPLTPTQADTLRQVQEILGGLMSGAKCKLDPAKLTEKLLSPNGPLRDIRSLQTQLQSLEGVLETSQNTIKVLLDVIQDLEKKEAVRDGRHLYRTGQDIENCGTCRDCACIIYSVEHDFRLQEGQVVRTWKVGDPPEDRPQTPTPPPSTPHQQDSPQAVRPPVSAKKNRKKCFWFL